MFNFMVVATVSKFRYFNKELLQFIQLSVFQLFDRDSNYSFKVNSKVGKTETVVLSIRRKHHQALGHTLRAFL